MSLVITKETKGSAVIIKLAGRLDATTSGEFERQVVQDIDPGAKVALSLEGLEYISSAGLRVVLMLGKRLNSGGGKLVLCGLGGMVEEVFKVSGFDKLFTIVFDLDKALEELG